MLYAMLCIKGRKSCAKLASLLAPSVGLILILAIRQRGARYVRVIRITGILLLGSLGIPGILGVIDAIREMDGRKPQVPSSSLVIQVRTEVLVLDTSQCVKGLVKELVGPRGDARILRPSPKEGSNGHEGREVRDEVPGHNWHLRQFWSRFQEGKEPISRIEEGARAVVQSNHLEFTQALQRRIFGKYINGELKPLLASTGRHYREA